MKKNRAWYLFFLITFSIFSNMFVTAPFDNIAVADSQVWENEYGRLEVEPSTSNNLIRQRQWYNLTWYYPDNTIDIAFGFNDSLSYGKVFYWNGANYIPVNVEHVGYDGRHFYVINNINVEQDETKHGYWEYDTPPMSNGKWDMYAKLSSDSWSTAFSTGRIIHLDPWWNSNWEKRKDIFIDKDQVGLGLKNFPVYINLSDSDILGDVQSDLGDIVFVDTTNTTQFAHEIEWIKSISPLVDARIWVNVTGINRNADTHINMYYDNPSCANQWNPTGVWDSDYLFVYHMNQSSGSQVWDSTSNLNHGTYNGSLPSQVNGIVGKGINFDNDNDWIFKNMGSYTHLDGTYEVWINPTSTAEPDVLMTDYFPNNYVKMDLRQDLNPDRWDFRGTYGGVDQWNTGSVLQATYTWQRAGMHWADGDEACLWRDGNNVLIDNSVDTVSFTNSNLYIGAYFDGSGDYSGVMDEIRYSKIKRNDSWMVASFNTIKNFSTFVTFGSEKTLDVTTDPVTSFTATTMSLTNITLDWTKPSNGNYTVIEYNTISNWVRGAGTEIYNGTDNNHSEWNLTARTLYYFQAWAFNETTHNFSNVVSTSNHTGPLNPTNINAIASGSILNFSWTKGNRASKTVIMRKTGSYPTTIGDGTEIYNDTGTTYEDTGYNTSIYYKFFAFNDTVNIASTGVNGEWTVLAINCYDENTSLPLTNWNVFISNINGSQVYENLSCINPTIIDIDELPLGDITITVGKDGYATRVYNMYISTNNLYTLNAYIPPTGYTDDEENCELRQYIDSTIITNPAVDATISLTHTLNEMIYVELYNKSLYDTYGGWIFITSNNYSFTSTQVIVEKEILDKNTTMVRVNYYYRHCEGTLQTALYNIRIVETIQTDYTSYDKSVENAFVVVKKFSNLTKVFETVSSLYTDANGYINLYFMVYGEYKIFVNKSGYENKISDYIPQPPNIYGQTTEKVFRLVRTGTEFPDIWIEDVWTNITFNYYPTSALSRNQYRFWFNITSSDCQLEWYRLETWYYNDSNHAWSLLNEQNDSNACGGNLSYQIPNVTGKYAFKLYYKKIGYDEQEISEQGSIIQWYTLTKAGLRTVPDYAWFIITIIIMLVGMGFFSYYFSPNVLTGYIGLGIMAMMLLFKDVTIIASGIEFSGWVIWTITFLLYTAGWFLWSRL